MKGENIPPPCRNVKTDNAERTHTLPPEIIEYILSRLPVKSLLKFRCVSKSWLSLIDSKSFIKTHFGNSTKNATFTRHKIILNYAPYYRLKFCSLLSLLNESFIDPFKFDESIKIRCDSICLVGCCNGLVCILLEKKYFFLWNPSTKMSKKLPDIDHMVKYGKVTKYGFGYDESSGDYKVFAIISVFWTTSGKVYSLKANSWKIMRERNVSSVEGVGKFASGKLHWASRIGIGLDSSWDIVSFDLQSEVYRMVEQPCYSERGFRLSLGVLGGCLSVLCDYRKTHFDVWIMKQYGVTESWDKLVTVSYIHCPWEGQFLTPLCVGSNGEIILSYGSTFIIYYPKDDVLRHPSTIYLRSFCEADIYVESLVSLVPDGDPTPETVE